VRHDRQRPVIIAVIAMGVMQAAFDEIIEMVSVGHGFVTTIRPVPVQFLMAAGVTFRIATVRIPVAYGNHVLLGAAAFQMLKPAVDEVVDVAFMLHGEMAASGAVNVRRSFSGAALFGCHGGSFVAHPQSPPKNMPMARG
jgi:hypothetical protein